MPYLLAALFLLALLALTGFLYERRAERRFRDRCQPPGRRVDLGGYCLHLVSLGEQAPGQPTVVLESGHGDWSVGWSKVQPEVARFARVCAYDRAGFGWSDPSPRPRAPFELVTELHDLLARAGEPGPYLLVGHSLGGALVRLFASLYPEEVAGMLWVDSAHEDMRRYIPFWRAANAAIVAAGGLGALLARFGIPRAFTRPLAQISFPFVDSPAEQALIAAQVAAPGFFHTMRAETTGWYARENWSRTCPGFAGLPVVMLEAQYPAPPPRIIPLRPYRQFRAGWQAIQEDLSRQSGVTRRIRVRAGHVIQREQPEVVVAAIREMLEDMRNGGGMS